MCTKIYTDINITGEILAQVSQKHNVDLRQGGCQNVTNPTPF